MHGNEPCFFRYREPSKHHHFSFQVDYKDQDRKMPTFHRFYLEVHESIVHPTNTKKDDIHEVISRIINGATFIIFGDIFEHKFIQKCI